MARPSKLTPEVRSRLIQAIGLGSTRKMACLYAGITHATLCNWENWAEPGHEHYQESYVELFEELDKAEGNATVGWLARIEQASAQSWQAAAWKLERKYPQDYGRTIQEQNHTGQVLHAHAWIERLQKGQDALDAKRVKQLTPASGVHNGSSPERTIDSPDG